MHRGTLLLLPLFVLLTGFGLYQAANYTITEDYSIRFDGSGAEGTFRGLSGTIVFDPNDLASARMDVRLESATIATGNTTKDRHARGEKWFDVERYPYISFVATDFMRDAAGYVAEGELTLHGVRKTVRLPFTLTETAEGGCSRGV
ncbi:Protein YceI [Neolewinella maritima]|uniref:Protein YceI n=1 Tax=Neolewinella maritima TaxID=1383882 RepID=A0ABM9B137_9BACT|nr:YceI family protein [Neolewinella maritima]CAH1000645.1 Protein YceI [Neolewinella maritima]